MGHLPKVTRVSNLQIWWECVGDAAPIQSRLINREQNNTSKVTLLPNH